MKAQLTFVPALMKQGDAAQYLSVSPRYMSVLIARGVVPSVKFGRRCVRLRKSDLDTLIAKQRNG